MSEEDVKLKARRLNCSYPLPLSDPDAREAAALCVPEGWRPLVRKLVDDLLPLVPDARMAQVKTKFGGLRFYVIGFKHDSPAGRLVQVAENASYSTCVVCGKAGVQNARFQVLCPEHTSVEV